MPNMDIAARHYTRAVVDHGISNGKLNYCIKNYTADFIGNKTVLSFNKRGPELHSNMLKHVFFTIWQLKLIRYVLPESFALNSLCVLGIWSQCGFKNTQSVSVCVCVFVFAG